LENPVGNDIVNMDNSMDGDNNVWDRVYKISSFGIFGVDRWPAIKDMEKLQYICEAVGEIYGCYETRGSIGVELAEVRYG